MAQNALPIQIQLASLPPQVAWTPQQLGDALVARMSLVTAQSYSLFVSGPTAPLSNAGPWFNTSTNSWWVFDVNTGTYIPEPVAYPNNYPVRAIPAVTQTIAIDTAKHKVNFGTEVFDPEAVFASSKYTAPVDGIYAVGCNLRVNNNGGAVALMQLALEIWKNGTTFMGGANCNVASPPGSTWNPNTGFQLIQMVAGDYLEIYLTADDGTNAANVDVQTTSYLSVALQHAL
jgi:hypothetical protein